MKSYAIKNISGTSLYEVFIQCYDEFLNITYTRNVKLVYDTYTKKFTFDLADHINLEYHIFCTPNLVLMNEDEFFQYSLVYEDSIGIGFDVYKLQSLQKAIIEYTNSCTGSGMVII